MDFIIDEVGVSQDDDVLVPSSQGPESSSGPRPNKRRRLNNFDNSSGDEDENDPSAVSNDDDEYDLPSTEQLDEFDNQKSRYDAVIHVPAYAASQRNQFVSQVEQPWSSPTAIRGPRWRKKSLSPSRSSVSPTRPAQARPFSNAVTPTSRPTDLSNPIVVEDFDDDDEELIAALIASENATSFSSVQGTTQTCKALSKNMRQTTLFGITTTQRNIPAATQARAHNWPMANRNEPPTHHKIDTTAMQTWIYPLNVGSLRDYQFNIVHRALFHNILVALPTGLGKTFIAATVMLNFFNWTKDAQIVFVAPTKPLVTQQVNACFNIAGIPRSHTTLLTGEVQPAVRAEEWQEKRVFFMTPQTLVNDLKTGMADPKKIVLLVVDEAHKATGNYAYVEVVRFLRRFNSSFRVLALTATPGATVEAVQKVIDGLDIARVEIRTEESMDIQRFVHKRNEDVELFDNSEEIDMCLDLFASAVRPVLSKVNSLNAYFSNDPKTMTLYGLRIGREQWAKSDAGRKADWGMKGMVNACFKPLMSLAHNLELLKFHGIGPFYHKMKIFDKESGSGGGKYTKQIVESDGYKKLMNRLRIWMNDDNFVGHPKLTYLNEVVLNHFMDAGSGLGAAGGRPPSDTRIMVFAHYRDSAEEIARVLNKHQPMIRAHVFVGQSGTKGSEGMDQKTQIDIIKKFKAGTYNTLVATSIGEEGLDIGEVDLIVCYDCSKSPIRMLQRMGRTGRKRAGRIVLLLMRGKEERDYHAAKDNYSKMQAIIESGKDFQFHEDASPRIVPHEIQPIVDKRNVDIPYENTQGGSPEPRKRKPKNAKRPPKKFHMPDNVETGFQFVGGKKKKDVQKKVPRPEPKADQQEATLPMLQDVLLSEREEQDLEVRYAQVAGSETQFVRAIQFDAFPQAIRRAGKTQLIKHSITTRKLIAASKVMHSSGSDWTRPDGSNILKTFNSSPPDRQRQPTQKSPRNPSRNDDLYESDSDATARQDDNDMNEYDLRDEFVDDGPLQQLIPSSFSEQTPNGNTQHLGKEMTILERPFYVSQQSVLEIDTDEEDLPDMEAIFKKRSSRNQNDNGSRPQLDKASKRPGRASRRVLSDDSDE